MAIDFVAPMHRLTRQSRDRSMAARLDALGQSLADVCGCGHERRNHWYRWDGVGSGDAPTFRGQTGRCSVCASDRTVKCTEFDAGPRARGALLLSNAPIG